jgi:hypothetical protein
LAIEALEDRMLLSYSFALIADTGPQSPYSGLDVGQAINDRGAVAFEASLRLGVAGIFTRNPDGSQGPIIAITGDLIRTFTLSPFMNDSGTVSFGAELRDGSTGIFTGRGQELTRVADTGPNSPFSSLPSTGAPQIHDNGTLYFRATLTSGGAGLFTGSGGLPSILYVTGGQFSAFLGAAELQRHGDTASFRATLSTGADCVCEGSGGPVTIIATTGDTYSSFLGSSINDAGTVVLGANLTGGGQVIVKPDGILADTSGPYREFFSGRLSSNNDDMVIFGADLKDGRRGIFRGPDPATDTIIATGDNLFNSMVTAFPNNFINPKGLNDAGQIVFRAELADGRTVLAAAQPDGDARASILQVASLVSGINLSGEDAGPVFVRTAGPRHSPSIDTSALSNPRFGDGDPLREKATVQLSEPGMASSSRLSGDVHERPFAGFEGDWLSDVILTNLALVG